MSFELSFFLGLLFTAGLFAFCLITVAIAKTVSKAVKRILPQKVAPEPEPEPTQNKRPKKPPTKIKCIEVDPALVDKIYVKKSS